MIDDLLILGLERLRDDLDEMRRVLRKHYPDGDGQVTSKELRGRCAQLAETWLVRVAADPEVGSRIENTADLTVHFQRLLTLTEHATKRKIYSAEIKAILHDFKVKVVIPLKQWLASRAHAPSDATVGPGPAADPYRGFASGNVPASGRLGGPVHSAFVGHSFDENDAHVSETVIQALRGVGIVVETGSRPKADRISEKVKRLIQSSEIFVGVFTRRDKISGKQEWTTTAWVIDEKAYAVGKGKKLILLREEGVGSIGGIQGDYEYIEFSRGRLEEAVLSVLSMFVVRNGGFTE